MSVLDLFRLDGKVAVVTGASSGLGVGFATALAEDIDKLTALRMGADDYVVKPFNPAEVAARVEGTES